MYEFYYGFLKRKYGSRCKLVFTDTDSFCCEIETDNVYADMGEAIELFDTSNFDSSHKLYSRDNHRVLGKMKSETGSTSPREFVGLRSKMYFLSCGGDVSHKKIKGIKKCYVKKNVHHESFLRVLNNTVRNTRAKFRLFRSTNHVINTIEMNKLCLSAFDDKRYVLDNGIDTLAYGHHSIR